MSQFFQWVVDVIAIQEDERVQNIEVLFMLDVFI